MNRVLTRRLARVFTRVLAALLAGAATILLTAAPAHADKIRDSQWFLDYLHTTQAQHISQGKGVTVAVIDTGVDPDVPELSGNLLPGGDAASDFTLNALLDTEGHGTEMACLIACHGTGPDTGALGIAPQATILPISINGVRNGKLNTALIAKAIPWAVQHGAKVINLSLGGAPPDDALRATIEQAVAADVIVIAAAGNKPEATAVAYPAAYPGVVAVSAIDQHGQPAIISVSGPQVMLAAPGVRTATAGLDGTYPFSGGTSAATAIVSGVAALIRAKYPTMSAKDVIHLMTTTATDAGPTGRDDHYGYGIINPLAALTTPPNNTTTATNTPPIGRDATGHHTTWIILASTGAAAILILTTGAILLARRRGTPH